MSAATTVILTSMSRWHPAAILLVGSTTSFVAGLWTYAYLNGDLRARDLLTTAAVTWQARILLRVRRNTCPR